MDHSLHSEIHAITDTDEHFRDFLFQRGILKSSMSYHSCSSNMTLVACSKSKSLDLLIWRCTPFKKFKNIRSESVLSGQKLSKPVFLMLIFYLSVKFLTNIAIAQLTGLSENTISDWKILLHTRVADWLIANPSPIGGPGVIVELEEAKFGKKKYIKRAYREGQWVLGGADRNTGQCFLLPCPGNKRDAPTLLPLIFRWILPGSVVYTDEWAAYNGLTAATYTHESVNHSIQFVDPSTGVHTNTQEGLWAKKAIPEVGVPRSSFYKYRYMAEMKIVDLAHYLYLKDQFRYGQQLSNECKEDLSEDGDFGRQAEQMRLNKQLLPN